MGVTNEFLLGKPEPIVSAFREMDVAVLENPEVVSQRADFSLHLEGSGLDALSTCLAGYNGRQALSLSECLGSRSFRNRTAPVGC